MKIAHLHLKDSMDNAYTLVCNLKEGSIRYNLYSSHNDSGTPNSLRNIQFYDVINGNMRWSNKSLPLENYEGESTNEFKNRIVQMLNNSTHKVVKEVNTKVTFTN